MKAIQLLALVGISTLAVSSSCGKAADSDPVPVVNLPVAVTLQVGQQVVSGPLTAKLIAIHEGRCAQEVCSLCYGGYATVQVDVTVPNAATRRLTFKRLSCLGAEDLTLERVDSLRVDLQQIGSFRVGLINLTDFVQANKLDPSRYIVKLLFQKK